MFLTVTLNPALDKTLFLPYNAPFDTIRCSRPVNLAGGKGLNVARALLGLEAAVTALFPAGGSPGAHLTALARQEGMDVIAVPVPGDSRLSLTMHHRESREYWHYVEAGPDLSEADLQRIWNAFLKALPGCHTMIVAGSLPCEAAADLPGRMIETARASGIRTALDCFGPSQAGALMKGAWLVKPTREELAATAGRNIGSDDELFELLEEIAARGSAIAVASYGAGGAVAVCEGRRLRVTGEPVETICDLGCGDSMVAGICWAARQNMPPAESLRWGAACGAANALTFDAGAIKLDQVRALLDRVIVREE